MKLTPGNPQRKLHHRAIVALTVAMAALIAVVGVVFADAPDPKPAQASVRMGDVENVGGVDVVRVSVSGEWQWPTHKKNDPTDCNTDRTGVGYAVDWGDPNQAGNHVTTLNSDSIDVGAAADNAYNDADNEVHPTRAQEAGSLFNEPGDPADFANWHSGCGSFGTMSTGVWGAVDLDTGNPIKCTGVSTPSDTCIGGSHVYTLEALQAGVTICAIMYDVHGDNSDEGGAPKDQKEVTAGGNDHNGDNGAEGNEDTPLGNTCAPITVTTPTPSAPPSVTATPTLPDTAAGVAGTANNGTDGTLLVAALIVLVAAALVLGSGWRRRTAKVVNPIWSTGSRK